MKVFFFFKIRTENSCFSMRTSVCMELLSFCGQSKFDLFSRFDCEQYDVIYQCLFWLDSMRDCNIVIFFQSRLCYVRTDRGEQTRRFYIDAHFRDTEKTFLLRNIFLFMSHNTAGWKLRNHNLYPCRKRIIYFLEIQMFKRYNYNIFYL